MNYLTVGKGKAMSIYQQLKDAGIPIDNHESDLYCLKTPESAAIVRAWEHAGIVTTFISQIDGKVWYDLPFAYEPFWYSQMRG